MASEKINFDFTFTSEYWNNPPYIDIKIDNNILYSGFIEKKETTISLCTILDFTEHTLSIERRGKSDAETKQLDNGDYITQMLILKKLKIDNIDVRNLIWHYSSFVPQYSESYMLENKNLEEIIPGELFFGHNGTWSYTFKSPHYMDVVEKVRGYV